MNIKKTNLINLPDKYFVFSIIILALYLLIRLLNQSNIIIEFPIDNKANDYSSHIAKLYFLKNYGFHSYIPNWYNGQYQLLKYYSPGWYIFSLPLAYLFNNNVQLATYISLILIYILLFFSIFILGKSQRISDIKTMALFLFTFANPVAIGYFLRLGKLPELFSWIWFVLLFTLLLFYKEKKLDRYFLLFLPLYLLLFYSHLLFFILSTIFILSFFLIKSNKERIYIVVLLFVFLLFASYFILPMLKNISGHSSININALERITYNERITNWIGAFLTPGIFILIFLLYISSVNWNRRELLFYIVPVVVALLLFSRILIYVPFLNKPESKSYDILFLFLSSFLLLKTKINRDSIFIKKLIAIGLTIIPIIAVFVSVYITPFFLHHPANVENTLHLLKNVDKNLAILGVPSDVHPGAVYSYAAIYYNITSIGGWDISGASYDYIVDLEELSTFLKNKNCGGLKLSITKLNVQEIISSQDYCNFLSTCELKKKEEIGNFCLYSNQ